MRSLSTSFGCFWFPANRACLLKDELVHFDAEKSSLHPLPNCSCGARRLGLAGTVNICREVSHTAQKMPGVEVENSMGREVSFVPSIPSQNDKSQPEQHLCKWCIWPFIWRSSSWTPWRDFKALLLASKTRWETADSESVEGGGEMNNLLVNASNALGLIAFLHRCHSLQWG